MFNVDLNTRILTKKLDTVNELDSKASHDELASPEKLWGSNIPATLQIDTPLLLTALPFKKKKLQSFRKNLMKSQDEDETSKNISESQSKQHQL
jgi:hypothetical protein